jgi:DNA-binding MarR family transcriptional regulator
MTDYKFISNLMDSKLAAVLKLFLTKPEHQFYLNEISMQSRVPVATTYRLVNKLVKMNMLKMTRVAKFKIYTLNETKNTQFLRGLIAS